MGVNLFQYKTMTLWRKVLIGSNLSQSPWENQKDKGSTFSIYAGFPLFFSEKQKCASHKVGIFWC